MRLLQACRRRRGAARYGPVSCDSFRRVAPCPRVACVWGASLWLTVGVLTGCSWARRGPCPDELVKCRQLTEQGLRAADQDDWQSAETLLKDAIDTYPTDSEARMHFADLLWRRGSRVAALDEVDQAIKLSPDDVKLLVRAAEWRLATGELRAAAERVEQALDVAPETANAWSLRGQILEQSGQLADALAAYHRSLAIDPRQPTVRQRLATVYLALGRPQPALAHLQAAQELYLAGAEPAELLALAGRANVALGRYDDAIEPLARAAERAPPTPELLCQLAEAQLLSGRVQPAEQALRTALAMDPAHANSRALWERMARSRQAPGVIAR